MPLHRKRRATPPEGKSGPPLPAGQFTLSACLAGSRRGVVLRKPLSIVVCLRVAPLRDCAALLVSGFLKTITVYKCGRMWV